jgi:7-cyano-7-deazaguanine tRNA-ribosyltransferase
MLKVAGLSFETRDKDLLARIGRLKTKTCTVETPLLFPVINPVTQLIAPKRIREEFGFEALITNAYILKSRVGGRPVEEGVHKFLGFDGAVMTDSGAYQILVYGDIRATQKEVVQYQEQIGSDVATILDIPTGWTVTEDLAERTVNETIKRAKEFFGYKTREDVLWVGPVQGGRYLNLVAHSAKEMSRLPFQIHALGSPTEVMERYRFDVLVDMIMTAKMNLPLDRPLHLFGAGHPFMFALAVALGCDLFDSAAYALYAKEGRYMTESGTHRLEELDYFPCTCPKCARATPKHVRELPAKGKEAFLAEHNLCVCASEIRRVKQAIRDGRLWELLEIRAHAHPALMTAVKRIGKYSEFIERHAPSVKDSGLFYFSSLGLARPEILHYQKRLQERYAKPKQATTLLLFPQTQTKPFHKAHEYRQFAKTLRQKNAHICFYAAPFGIIPIELDEVYPLSQHEIAPPLDMETKEHVAQQTTDYIKRAGYKNVILVDDPENWGKTVRNACRRACKQTTATLNILRLNDRRRSIP